MSDEGKGWRFIGRIEMLLSLGGWIWGPGLLCIVGSPFAGHWSWTWTVVLLGIGLPVFAVGCFVGTVKWHSRRRLGSLLRELLPKIDWIMIPFPDDTSLERDMLFLRNGEISPRSDDCWRWTVSDKGVLEITRRKTGSVQNRFHWAWTDCAFVSTNERGAHTVEHDKIRNQRIHPVDRQTAMSKNDG